MCCVTPRAQKVSAWVPSGRNVAGALVRFLESAVAAARETPADAAAPGA